MRPISGQDLNTNNGLTDEPVPEGIKGSARLELTEKARRRSEAASDTELGGIGYAHSPCPRYFIAPPPCGEGLGWGVDGSGTRGSPPRPPHKREGEKADFIEADEFRCTETQTARFAPGLISEFELKLRPVSRFAHTDQTGEAGSLRAKTSAIQGYIF